MCDTHRRSLLCWCVTCAFVFFASCNRPGPEAALPYTGETDAISVVLYDENSGNISGECAVADSRTIREIIDCLTPFEESDLAEASMRGPKLGKLTFRGPRGATVVEFVSLGKNPVGFRIATKSYARWKKDYRGYRSDHKRLYGHDADAIDEGLLFYRKLLRICAATNRGEVVEDVASGKAPME